MNTDTNKINEIIALLRIEPLYRSEAQVTKLVDSLSHFDFFKKLMKTGSSKIVFRNLQMMRVTKGQYVFKYGDNPNCFYVVISGSVSILVPKKVMSGSDWNLGTISDDDFKPILTVKEGQGFGELALLANRPRAASVLVDKDSILAVCDKKTYIEHVKEIEKYKLDKKLSFLNKHIWPGIEDTLALKTSYYFNEITLMKNKKIFSQNSQLNNLYLIVKGKVSVS